MYFLFSVLILTDVGFSTNNKFKVMHPLVSRNLLKKRNWNNSNSVDTTKLLYSLKFYILFSGTRERRSSVVN